MSREATIELADLVLALASHFDLIWDQYALRGPGAVDPSLIGPVDELGGRLEALMLQAADGLPREVTPSSLEAAVRQATDLARRCATWPQGLCFVSGEAGLVPRRDQIDAFAAARASLHDVARQLASG